MTQEELDRPENALAREHMRVAEGKVRSFAAITVGEAGEVEVAFFVDAPTPEEFSVLMAGAAALSSRMSEEIVKFSPVGKTIQ